MSLQFIMHDILVGTSLAKHKTTAKDLRSLGLMALLLFSTSTLGQDTTNGLASESLIEEVYEHRLNTLQDSLFLRQEQLDAANFLVNQLQDESAQLQDSLNRLTTESTALVDSLAILNIAHDQLTTENQQYQTQLSALSDSLAVGVTRHADLLGKFESAQLISDSLSRTLTATQAELFIADSSSMSYADTLAAMRSSMNKLSTELMANEEGLSGMYERLKSVVSAVGEGAYDTTKDERYLQVLTNTANYQVENKGIGRLFGGAGPDEYINRYKFAEYNQYLDWIELDGHTPEVFNYLGDHYAAGGEPVIASLVYLKNLFVFPESEASAAAANALNELVEKDGELGHLYYEVVLNPDSLNVGDEKFYRYLQYLDHLHRLNDPSARRWFLTESGLFLGLYPGIFQSDKITYWQALTYHALEEYHNEILTYQKIPVLFPESEYIPDCKYNMAEVTTKQLELYADGAEGYAAFRAEFPDHDKAPAALLAEAAIYSEKLKEYRKASDLLRELADTYPESDLAPIALFSYAGLSRNNLTSTAQALAVYEEILSAYGQDQNIGIPALEGLASISRESGQYEAAVVYYLDIYDRFPESNEAVVEAILEAAEIYEKNLKNLDAAIHTLHIVLDNYPDYPGTKSLTKKVQKLQKKKG
jgi:TolA-binding protein